MSEDLEIIQGKTFQRVVRWESLPFIYKAITAIDAIAPMRLTVPLHGAPNGWRATRVSVKGMTEANAELDEDSQPVEESFRPITVVDPNTVEFNSINAAEFKPYVSGGYLQFYTPVDLTGYTARMTIKDAVGGTELISMTSVNGKIVIDNTAKTITLLLSAVETAGITWSHGVYDLEMVSPTGVVTALLSGDVNVVPEVTT